MFPARAGMSRSPAFPRRLMYNVPRASGDETGGTVLGVWRAQCSPRERG